MKIIKEGKRKPAYEWAEKYWRGSDCGTVVYLEETDAVEYSHDAGAHPYEDSRQLFTVCPVCNRRERFYPTTDPSMRGYAWDEI